MFKVGDRVKVTVETGAYQLKDTLGIVFYIDSKNLLNDWSSPIQVELDEPYDDSGQRMLRVSKKEVSLLE